MAIAKIEKRSATVWNRSSAVSAGIGGFLALISLFLLWGAFKSFMVRTNYVEAAYKHDSNQKLEVRSAAEKARAWGKHSESAQLLAKILVETNQLDAADKVYTDIANGVHRPLGLVGQGIVLLRRADAEKDLKKCTELARKAKDRFNEAKAADPKLIEAQIGVWTADILTGVRSGGDNSKPAKELGKILSALRSSEDAAAHVTREGYIDLYVGLARAHASPTKFSSEALGFAGSARRYLPPSLSLYAMEVALQAQQMSENPPPTAEIKAARMFEKLKQLKERIVTSQKVMEPLIDPWFALTLATASALGRGGETAASNEILSLAKQFKGDETILAAVLEASMALEVARTPESNWNKRQTNYSQAYGRFVSVNAMKELQEPSRALLRAALLNDQAFFEEDTAAQGGGEPRYEAAVSLLKKALEAEQAAGLPDGSYEVRRNLAVIQKRRGKPDAADHFLAAQRAAAARSESTIRQDLEDLEKYFRN